MIMHDKNGFQGKTVSSNTFYQHCSIWDGWLCSAAVLRWRRRQLASPHPAVLSRQLPVMATHTIPGAAAAGYSYRAFGMRFQHILTWMVRITPPLLATITKMTSIKLVILFKKQTKSNKNGKARQMLCDETGTPPFLPPQVQQVCLCGVVAQIGAGLSETYP